MEKKVSILNNRSVIKISGKDSLLFLNNIISSDLEKINHEELFITTILSPQGKILFDFFIIIIIMRFKYNHLQANLKNEYN